jgi:DME family drug/metabolite transporter
MPARSSFLFLVLAGLLWGTGGVTGHALADASGLAAPAIGAYRIGLGGLLLVLPRAFRKPMPPGAWPRIAATGALAAVFQSAYFASVAIGTVSAATLITIGSAPIFVVIAEAVHRRRRPAPRELRPVVAGVAGLALLVGAPAGGASLAAGVAAACLAALSGLAFAAFTMLGRRPLPAGGGRTIEQQDVTGYGFLAGGVGLALVIAPFTSLQFQPTGRSLLLLALFAVVPTALAYTLFFRGLRHATAATATVVALLEPLTGTALAIWIFGDRLGLLGGVGAALLLLSVLDAGRAQLVQVTPAEPGQASGPGPADHAGRR